MDETSGSWFGGGADLTPYYLFDEDITTFHQQYHNLCAYHGKEKGFHDKFKKWCDDYFYLPARGEHRGVGGIFFDDLSSFEDDGCSLCSHHLDEAEAFTKAVCETWMPSYLPIVRARRNAAYTEEQRHWQLLRRGRYIEFNMLYDRGVKVCPSSFLCVCVRVCICVCVVLCNVMTYYRQYSPPIYDPCRS